MGKSATKDKSYQLERANMKAKKRKHQAFKESAQNEDVDIDLEDFTNMSSTDILNLFDKD